MNNKYPGIAGFQEHGCVMSQDDNWYSYGSMIFGGIAFLWVWAHCAATYGFLFGFGFGWVPAAIVAAIVAVIWPVIFIGIILLILAIVVK